MTVRHKDPCPCGSGKKYKHCHLKKDREKREHGIWLLLGAVVVIGAAALYFARGGPLPWGGGQAGEPPAAGRPVGAGTQATQRIPVTTTTATAAGTTVATAGASADQSPLPGGATPQPWQYDAPRNRFWHPDHAHWHDGPPPDPAQRAASAATRTATTTNLPAPPGVDQSPLPGGAVPAPNYYDAAKDRYWVAEHAHWHPGRPPATATATPAATPATTTAPAPLPSGQPPATPPPAPAPTP
jgi:hypothetical protein